MIAAGSSERGLSEVRITRSASFRAISPISGRLPRSRSPPAPNATWTRRSAGPARAGAPPLGQAPRGEQHVAKRVGRVGVVDQHRESLAFVDRLEASRN